MTSIAKNYYFSGGSGLPAPPLDPRMGTFEFSLFWYAIIGPKPNDPAHVCTDDDSCRLHPRRIAIKNSSQNRYRIIITARKQEE